MIKTVDDIKKLIKEKRDSALSLEDRLKLVDYNMIGKNPSEFAINYINFIKLASYGTEENLNAPFHLDMVDNCLNNKNSRMSLNVCFRGSSKTTMMLEYLIFYLAIFKELPYVRNIDAMLVIADSMDNGITSLVDNLRTRYDRSPFLKEYIPKASIVKEEFRFTNKSGQYFIVAPNGIKQGIRGAKRKGVRPKVAVLDDIFKDSDVESDVIMDKISKVIDSGIKYAMHPSEQLIIWNNTVFNEEDLVYKAIKSGAWNVNVYPLCNKFPCDRDKFVGAWEDRFGYDEVAQMYIEAELSENGVASFYQEMMLDVTSRRVKVIDIDKLKFISRKPILENSHLYNFYITTDIAVTDTKESDYTVIAVWAYTSNDSFILVDIFMDQCFVDVFYEQLFRLVKRYKPNQVAVEVSGQQKAIVTQINSYMAMYNTFFDLVEVRPTTSKLKRFLAISNRINSGNIMLYKELKDHVLYDEIINELKKVTKSKISSKHDDFLDCVSQLQYLNPIDTGYGFSDEDDIRREFEDYSNSIIGRYVV